VSSVYSAYSADGGKAIDRSNVGEFIYYV